MYTLQKAKILGEKVSFIRQIKRNGHIYYAEVQNKRDGSKIRQKFIRYIKGNSAQKKDIFPSNFNEISLDSCRLSGSIAVLDWLANQLGLYELLGEYAQPILTLVFCHCHDYQSTLKASLWFEKTDLNRIFKTEKMSNARLRETIFALGKVNLLELQKSIFEKITAFTGENDLSVLYDVTNTYFTGKNCKLAKMGLDKEGVRGRKLIQIGLLITKKNGLPIFHQLHPGNIHDSKIFSEAMSVIRLFGIHKGIIVYDRGIGSKESTFKLSNEHWKIIAGMPNHRGIKAIISKMDLSSIEKYRNRITQGDTVFYFKIVKYSFGSIEGKLIILLNPWKRDTQRENRLSKITNEKDKLCGKKTIIAANPKLKKFFNRNGKINTHELKRAAKFDGLSYIFTNGKFSTKEIVRIYFDRGLIERSFHSLKGALGLRPIRFWLEENVTVHLFICYLAYVLMTTFRFQIKKASKRKGFKALKDLTAEEAFDELTRTYRVYFHKPEKSSNEDLPPSKVITLTKIQKQVLKAISKTLVLE